MTKIFSFDVFDTVLTRAVGDPTAVFLLLGKRLKDQAAISCSAEAFAHTRIEAEKRARKNSGSGEVTLNRIYQELGTSLGLSEHEWMQLLSEEFALETELIRPIPNMVRHLQAVRTSGGQIAFISDTYFSSQFIQEQLKRHGFWQDGDSCYVSCEYNKAKSNGRLFQELLHSVSVSPKEVIHHGNDQTADIDVPQKANFLVKPFLEANLNRFEKILESYKWATEGLSSMMAGASRTARLSVETVTKHEKAIRDVAAGVVAPTLTGFILWLLTRAKRIGLKRLYFVSRDGQILYRIATELASKMNIPCELSYIYGGRQAWHLPAITEINEEPLSWIIENTTFLSLRSMLKRVAIEPEEIRTDLHDMSFTEEQWDKNLSSSERLRIFRWLMENSNVKNLIVKRAAERRILVLEYLKQEGLCDRVKYGVVDIGWHGRLLDSLGSILPPRILTQANGFYFGLMTEEINESTFKREAYFLDKRFGTGFIRPVSGLEPMMETFCAADHGTVIGYQYEGRSIVPILKEKCNQAVINWGLPIIQRTVQCFVESLWIEPQSTSLLRDLRPAIHECHKSFWLNPSIEEARAWGAFPYVDDQCEIYVDKLAEGYGWKDVIMTLWQKNFPRRHRCAWIDGSVILSKPIIRFLMNTIHVIRANILHLGAHVRNVGLKNFLRNI